MQMSSLNRCSLNSRNWTVLGMTWMLATMKTQTLLQMYQKNMPRKERKPLRNKGRKKYLPGQDKLERYAFVIEASHPVLELFYHC